MHLAYGLHTNRADVMMNNRFRRHPAGNPQSIRTVLLLRWQTGRNVRSMQLSSAELGSTIAIYLRSIVAEYRLDVIDLLSSSA